MEDIMAYEKLKQPITIGSMTIKNRMVVPPLATNYATRQGFITDKMIAFYAERAKGGFGLIEIEVGATCPQGRSIPNEIGLWSDDYIPGLTNLLLPYMKMAPKRYSRSITAAGLLQTLLLMMMLSEKAT